MTFCKKGFHSFLSFTNLSDSSPPPPAPKCLPSVTGIGLMTATGDTHRLPNVLESAAVRPPLPMLFADGDVPRKEPDGNGILRVGFFEELGEVVDGLMSCTESLGFESSDERRVDDERMEDVDRVDSDPKSCMLSRAKRREESQRIRERKFPPPLTTWNDKGRPSFFLKPMRRDGRLELMEVRIERPEILHASRGDGRLRLEFVKDPEVKEEMYMKDVGNEGDAEEEKAKVANTGEGRGRCHEGAVAAVGNSRSHHHRDSGHNGNHNLNVWRQRCVTIG